MSGDGDYGKPWSGPWAMAYPNGTVPSKVTVQPTPIDEISFCAETRAIPWDSPPPSWSLC